ncbi:4'-phosphopantetheinyl transferase [Roseovarius sp. MMSF_3281]|uniref:4'-phosphopantetheinyl transferase family protein n=1 Tax=Roseovarius sp. MMSF_3281 TaxID=3046694 RepID=UPI00274019D9|nr:4'-phosphopantetheinyl transferase superfamily protein [Roseovarius sp. MMSF_3281]
MADIFAEDTIEAIARDLFPEDVAVGFAFPWGAPEGMLPGEPSGLVRPTQKRLAEFAAGRRAAHQAMERLGVPVRAVAHGLDRAPVWPRGLVGGISHTDTHCLAVVAQDTDYAALGLDLEADEDLPRDLIEVVCTPAERGWLSVQPHEVRGRLARLIFSAKECAYKAQFGLTRQLIGFEAFEITPDLETGQFEATFTQDVLPFTRGACLHGQFAFGGGIILTGMALPGKDAAR